MITVVVYWLIVIRFYFDVVARAAMVFVATVIAAYGRPPLLSSAYVDLPQGPQCIHAAWSDPLCTVMRSYLPLDDARKKKDR